MGTGLKGRTVLITAASRHIGHHTAVLLAREGANLAICSKKRRKLTWIKFVGGC